MPICLNAHVNDRLLTSSKIEWFFWMKDTLLNINALKCEAFFFYKIWLNWAFKVERLNEKNLSLKKGSHAGNLIKKHISNLSVIKSKKRHERIQMFVKIGITIHWRNWIIFSPKMSLIAPEFIIFKRYRLNVQSNEKMN